MAVKDHTLDDKIIKAARAEFMEHGFQKASLRKIADKAGITTGALYTRYKNKDALFYRLVEDAVNAMRASAEPLREAYASVEKGRSIRTFLEAMAYEEKVYLDILFQYYDECTLIFCHSMGSTVEGMLEKVVEVKTKETVAFFEQHASEPMDLSGVELIITGQLQFYRLILQKGYDKEQALSCLKTMELFFEAGWRKLFEQIM